MEFFFGLIVGAFSVIAIALLLFGDREQDIVDDDPPTLDTRGDQP